MPQHEARFFARRPATSRKVTCDMGGGWSESRQRSRAARGRSVALINRDFPGSSRARARCRRSICKPFTDSKPPSWRARRIGLRRKRMAATARRIKVQSCTLIPPTSAPLNQAPVCERRRWRTRWPRRAGPVARAMPSEMSQPCVCDSTVPACETSQPARGQFP